MKMKKITAILAVAVLAAGQAVQGTTWTSGTAGEACVSESVQVQAKPKKELKEVTFSVSMHCENCVEKIKENISFEKGVKGLEVSLDKKTVKVTYDPSKTDEARLAEALKKLGYEVEKA